MANKRLSVPDYNYWCKFDSWSLKDCALLLQGIDPLNFKDVSFNAKEVPKQDELKEAYKIFLLLKNVIKDEPHLRYSQFIHPYEAYMMAVHKNILVPDELAECLIKRHEDEKDLKKSRGKKLTMHQQTILLADDKELSSRERHTLLKSLGIMAILLMEDSKYSKEFNLNNRPNAFRIAEAVVTKAQALESAALTMLEIQFEE